MGQVIQLRKAAISPELAKLPAMPMHNPSLEEVRGYLDKFKPKKPKPAKRIHSQPR